MDIRVRNGENLAQRSQQRPSEDKTLNVHLKGLNLILRAMRSFEELFKVE